MINYNQDLKKKKDCCNIIDIMVLCDINYHTEWLVEEMRENSESIEEMVCKNDDLTWS